jgi:hypothetical protein
MSLRIPIREKRESFDSKGDKVRKSVQTKEAWLLLKDFKRADGRSRRKVKKSRGNAALI